ncbi:hypothetical protein HXX76_010192 [Chlamydomonas incerta]|uniref:mRNA m(6)A methyltransferase n=1 Tax=Chlamydomonas incerta TaxID=51695 RepID=A0A835VY20_CHLIN|nr:hypothetical protein HXX76_010192 [Chlamydomonas incerta]|eukprot:KAG2430093.1 hypothetical protein HXX76_010192 [Chlamydomonas incerta]
MATLPGAAAAAPGPDAEMGPSSGPQDALQQRIAMAEGLLALPEVDVMQSWQQMPREALLEQVAKYRGAVRDMASALRSSSLAVSGGPEGGLPQADELLVLGRDAAHHAAVAASAAAAAAAAAAGATGGSTSAGAAGAGGAAGDDDAAAAAAADPDAAAAAAGGEFSHLGEEGVDYTFGSVDELDPAEWQVPPHCVPIHANVTTFDWPSLYNHAQFDVIMMDPPWQLATANPTRGVALGYSQLNDDHISRLPVPQLQRQGGYLFVWVINAKYKWTLDLFDRWGYRLVDEVVWVKMTVNRRLAKSHGYYLQHAKEVCLVAKRGNPPVPPGCEGGVGSDIIFSERRGQSQKPEEIYHLIEQLVPNGRYLEIFARKNNLRNYWVSIGNEVTGTGLPDEDMQALRELHHIPGAVYGKNGGGGGGPSNGGAAPPASRGPSGGGAAPPAAARAAAAKPPLPLGPTAAAAAATSAAAAAAAAAEVAAEVAAAAGAEPQGGDVDMPQAEDADDALPTPLAAPPPAAVAAAAQRQQQQQQPGAGGAGAGPGAGEPEDVSIGLCSLPSLGMLESALRSGGAALCGGGGGGGGGGALDTCARGGADGGGRLSVGPGLSGLSAGPLHFD